MKRAVLFLGIFLITTTVFAQSISDSKKEIAEEFNGYGIQTLGELLQMNTGWFAATTDDATIQYAGNGLAGPGGSWWPVYYNGIRLDLNVWDTKSLHAMPIAFSQIDSVVIVDEPMLYNGTFTEKGGLFIYSDTPQKGLQVESEIMTGNKSGDPGPFVYTQEATRNLERLGPVAYASISYGKDKYALQANFKHYVHSVSDPLQYRRITPLEFGQGTYRHPKIEGNALYLRGDYFTDKFKNQIQFGGSSYTDFLFTGIYGTEIPVDRKWGFASLTGKGELSDFISINYRLKRSMNDVEEYPNKDNRQLRWQQQVTAGQTSASYSSAKIFNELGMGFDYYQLEDEAEGDGQLSTALFRLFNRTRYRFSDRLTFNSGLTAVKGDEDGIAMKAQSGFKYQVRNQTFSLDASYSERFPEEDNSLWSWVTEKGFGGDLLATFQSEEIQERIRYLYAKVGWSGSLTNSIDAQSGVSVSRNLDEYLLDYMLYKSGGNTSSGSHSFINDLDATFLSIPAQLTIQYTPNLKQNFSYTWRNQLSGETDFWDMVPEHQLDMILNWKPVDSFRIWSKIHFQSKTNWPSADSLDQKTVTINPSQTVTYYSDFDSRFGWDIGISKTLWDDRLRFKLDALNILNRRYRNHPLGPQHTFTLFLRLRLRFPD